MSLYKSLGFFVLAPESQIKAGVFSGPMSKDGIRDRLRERVQMYDGQTHIELQKWLNEWALPLVDRMELSCCSWESVIHRVSMKDLEYGASLGEFYGLCLKYNAGAGNASAGAGS